MAIPTGTKASNTLQTPGAPITLGDGTISYADLVVQVDSTGTAAPVSSSADPSFAVNTPASTSGAALTRVQTSVVASSLIVKASPGNLYGYNAVSGASAGYLMFFDAVSAPADGTVTPKMCLVMAANASLQSDRTLPIRFTTGIVMVFSTTGPFTKTASATAFLAGDAA